MSAAEVASESHSHRPVSRDANPHASARCGAEHVNQAFDHLLRALAERDRKIEELEEQLAASLSISEGPGTGRSASIPSARSEPGQGWQPGCRWRPPRPLGQQGAHGDLSEQHHGLEPLRPSWAGFESEVSFLSHSASEESMPERGAELEASAQRSDVNPSECPHSGAEAEPYKCRPSDSTATGLTRISDFMTPPPSEGPNSSFDCWSTPKRSGSPWAQSRHHHGLMVEVPVPPALHRCPTELSTPLTWRSSTCTGSPKASPGDMSSKVSVASSTVLAETSYVLPTSRRWTPGSPSAGGGQRLGRCFEEAVQEAAAEEEAELEISIPHDHCIVCPASWRCVSPGGSTSGWDGGSGITAVPGPEAALPSGSSSGCSTGILTSSDGVTTQSLMSPQVSLDSPDDGQSFYAGDAHKAHYQPGVDAVNAAVADATARAALCTSALSDHMVSQGPSVLTEASITPPLTSRAISSSWQPPLGTPLPSPPAPLLQMPITWTAPAPPAAYSSSAAATAAPAAGATVPVLGSPKRVRGSAVTARVPPRHLHNAASTPALPSPAAGTPSLVVSESLVVPVAVKEAPGGVVHTVRGRISGASLSPVPRTPRPPPCKSLGCPASMFVPGPPPSFPGATTSTTSVTALAPAGIVGGSPRGVSPSATARRVSLSPWARTSNSPQPVGHSQADALPQRCSNTPPPANIHRIAVRPLPRLSLPHATSPYGPQSPGGGSRSPVDAMAARQVHRTHVRALGTPMSATPVPWAWRWAAAGAASPPLRQASAPKTSPWAAAGTPRRSLSASSRSLGIATLGGGPAGGPAGANPAAAAALAASCAAAAAVLGGATTPRHQHAPHSARAVAGPKAGPSAAALPRWGAISPSARRPPSLSLLRPTASTPSSSRGRWPSSRRPPATAR